MQKKIKINQYVYIYYCHEATRGGGGGFTHATTQNNYQLHKT